MATRQTRRQLQFTGFEMAMIAVSFVITVTSVFFLGLLVGKKNASYHTPVEDRVARVPVDDFTKYKRPAPIPPVVKERPPAAADAAAASASASAPAAATVEGKGAATPAATAASATPPVAAADAAAAPVATASVSATPVDVAAAAQETVGKDAAAKEATAKLAAAKAKEAAAAKEKEKDEPVTGRGYTVQILDTRKQDDADALVHKLKTHGYAAYIKKVSDGEGARYRVRVGSYGAFQEARTMADKCRRDLALGSAFVSTE